MLDNTYMDARDDRDAMDIHTHIYIYIYMYVYILVYIILGTSFIRAKQVYWLSERRAIWIHITRVRQDECNMIPRSTPLTKPSNLLAPIKTSVQYNI